MEPFHICGDLTPGDDATFFGVAARKITEGHKELTLTINSTGGSVGTCLAIYALLRSLPVPVTTHVVGTCQSGAVLIFLAGSRRLVSPGASLMLHGPAREMRGGERINLEVAKQIIESLERDREAMVSVLADRLGIDHQRALQYMTGEHWFNATEATEAKFAHQIAPFGPASPMLFKA